MPERFTPIKPKQIVAALLASFIKQRILKQAGLTEGEFLHLL